MKKGGYLWVEFLCERKARSKMDRKFWDRIVRFCKNFDPAKRLEAFIISRFISPPIMGSYTVYVRSPSPSQRPSVNEDREAARPRSARWEHKGPQDDVDLMKLDPTVMNYTNECRSRVDWVSSRKTYAVSF